MKQLLTVLLILTSVSASAKSITVFNKWAGYADDMIPEFMVNKDLGRAWVNIVTVDDWGEDEYETDNFVKIEGLSFNQETQQIVYTDGTSEVVCATVRTRGRGIFRRTKIVNSGECNFVHTVERRSLDDGFRVSRRKYDIIRLEINI